MRFRILGVIGAIALLTSCASTPERGTSADSGTNDKTAADAPDSGVLKAVVLEGKPFASKEGDTYEGFAVDVINHVKDEAGLSSVEFVPASSVTDGFKAITSGEADIACGVSFTWDRAKTVNFSLPFAIGGTRLLAGAGVDGTPESLTGKTIGVIADSASAKVLGDVVPSAEFTGFATSAEAIDALEKGDVEILGGPTLWLASNKGETSTSLVPDRPYGRSGIGCVVKQDNGKLLSAANLAIGQMMQAYVDGDAGSREMINRWVGPDSAIDLSESTISALYRIMLGTTAEISTNVKDPVESQQAETAESPEAAAATPDTATPDEGTDQQNQQTTD